MFKFPFVSRRRYESTRKLLDAMTVRSNDLLNSYRTMNRKYEKVCALLDVDPKTGDPINHGTPGDGGKVVAFPIRRKQ